MDHKHETRGTKVAQGSSQLWVRVQNTQSEYRGLQHADEKVQSAIAVPSSARAPEVPATNQDVGRSCCAPQTPASSATTPRDMRRERTIFSLMLHRGTFAPSLACLMQVRYGGSGSTRASKVSTGGQGKGQSVNRERAPSLAPTQCATRLTTQQTPVGTTQLVRLQLVSPWPNEVNEMDILVATWSVIQTRSLGSPAYALCVRVFVGYFVLHLVPDAWGGTAQHQHITSTSDESAFFASTRVDLSPAVGLRPLLRQRRWCRTRSLLLGGGGAICASLPIAASLNAPQAWRTPFLQVVWRARTCLGQRVCKTACCSA